jgi:hypothetical protein
MKVIMVIPSLLTYIPSSPDLNMWNLDHSQMIRDLLSQSHTIRSQQDDAVKKNKDADETPEKEHEQPRTAAAPRSKSRGREKSSMVSGGREAESGGNINSA